MRKARMRPEILIIILLTAWSSARGETDALERFNSEYPPAARRLEERFGTVKGTCRLSEVEPDGSKPGRESTAEFAVGHGYEKVTIRRKVSGRGADAASGEFIYCVRSDTGSTFYLSRMSGADSYLVEGIGSSAVDRSAYVTLFGRFLNAHYGVFGKPLTRSMQAPGYRIVKAEYVTEGESRLIKVDFEVGSQDPRSTISVVFDPQDGWNIRSSDFRTGNTPGVRISTEVSYGPPRIDGFSLPSRVVSRLGSGATSTCDFTDWKFESTPEAEFKMSFYNVPDLVDVPKNRKTLYISMFVGAAAVVFAAALVFRRYGYGPAG